MSELNTIARPYAEAAFEFALENQTLDKWQDFLNLASALAAEPEVIRALSNPEVSDDDVISLILSADKSDLGRYSLNYLQALAKNKRLAYLPQIYKLFTAKVLQHRKEIVARVVSAAPIPDEQQSALAKALAKRYGGAQATLKCKVDESLLGGATVYIGNLVIDYSVRGSLTRLSNHICN